VLALLLVLVLVLAACGGGDGGSGPGASAAAQGGDTASLWVTRDRGADVMVETDVPATGNAIQALDRETNIETRYGGRFVQSVNGVEGDLEGRHDWFFFVNGIEPDRGGAEVKLRPGDVVWWDYRDWGETERAPVVVGAFPEPFAHGWNGERRPAEVRAPPGFDDEAEQLLAVLGGSEGTGDPNVFVVEVTGDDGASLTAERGARNDSPATFTLAGSEEAVRAALDALIGDPSIVRFRYEARFGPDGAVE
jgi:hypothetical protein